MSNKFKRLVAHFQNSVREAEELMQKEFNVSDPWTWRQNRIPIRGRFREYKYYFHGIGCYFNFGDYFVDYDYGDEGRIDGFDLWRLSRFGEQFEEYRSYIESGALNEEFEAHIETGGIKHSGGKYDNLYYVHEYSGQIKNK